MITIIETDRQAIQQDRLVHLGLQLVCPEVI